MKKFYEINLNEFLKEIAKRTLKEIEHTPMYEGQGGFTYHTEIPYVARRRLQLVIEEYSVSPEKRGEVGAYQFYIDRLFASLNYGERSGMEIVKTVCRCAFADEVLTDAESISIINICHSPEWHKIFMEVNYNEGWN